MDNSFGKSLPMKNTIDALPFDPGHRNLVIHNLNLPGAGSPIKKIYRYSMTDNLPNM